MADKSRLGNTDLVFVVTVALTAETFVRKFATFVANSGLSVVVIADGVTPESKKIGLGTLRFVPLSMEREPNILKDFKSLIRMIILLRKLQPAILLYATPKASLISGIAGTITRIPTRIYQIWGLRLETVGGLRRKIFASLEKATSLASTKLVANSKSLSERYCELGLNVGKPVAVVGQGSSHGVDVQYFSRDAEIPKLNLEWSQFMEDKGDYLKVGFVGRKHPDKGIDTLVDAVSQIADSGVKVLLIIIGGDEGANIVFPNHSNVAVLDVGHVQDVRPYYLQMDMLSLPSLREGFPNVVLEAAAMEIPSIVSNGTGVRDSVVDGVTGKITPVGDSDLLAKAILELFNNRALAEKLGKNAKERVLSDFVQEHIWKLNLEYLSS